MNRLNSYKKRGQVQPQIRDTMGCPSWSLLDFVICHLRATIRLAISNGYLYFLICLWTWNGHYLGIGHASTFSESCRRGMLFKMDRLQKKMYLHWLGPDHGRMNTKCCLMNYIGPDLHVISVLLAALARASALSVDGYVWAVAWYSRRGNGWPLNYIGQTCR